MFGINDLVATLKAMHSQLMNIGRLLNTIHQEQLKMAVDLSALQAQVQQNTTVEQSAVTLIQGLAQQLQAAQNDPAAIQSIINSLNSSANSLADAITANTPSQASSPASS